MDRLSRRDVLRAFSLLPAASLLRGQQEKQETQEKPVFSSNVKVVNLLATVRDKKGLLVKDLAQDDFQLDEEGRPQTIRYFSRETDLPLTLGLLVDTSGSQRGVLGAERTASRSFLRKLLRVDRDLAFLIHFDFEVELLQDLTADREKLEKAIDECQMSQDRRQPGQGGQYPPQGGGYPGGGQRGGRRGAGGGTALYDAVLLASDELMKKQKGRKALIVLSDGVDHGSKVSLSEGVEAAQRADTLVYSILFTDSNGYGNLGGFGGPGMGRRGRGMGRGGPVGGGEDRNGKAVLQRISAETGGRFYEVSRKLPIDKVFEAIDEELRNQYNIGYTPDQDSGGMYRRIHLTTKQKGLTVQTREGYYPA